PEIPNKSWLGRIAEVIDLGHSPHFPIRRPGNKIGDAGIAFPETLIRIPKPTNQTPHPLNLCRFGHVPAFVSETTVGTHKENLPFIRPGQLMPFPHPNNLRSPQSA